MKKVSHEEIVDVMKPAYIFSIVASVLTAFATVFMFNMLLGSPGVERFDGSTLVVAGLFIHAVITLLMMAGSFLLYREHFAMAGSIIMLVSGIVGLSFAVGLIVGPILAIISGVLGMQEHEKIAKHHF